MIWKIKKIINELADACGQMCRKAAAGKVLGRKSKEKQWTEEKEGKHRV